MTEFASLSKRPVRRQILLLGAVITLANLAAIIHKSSQVFLFQQSQCLAYYMTIDPTKIDSSYTVEEGLCKIDEIQSRLSITVGIDSFLSYLPGKPFRAFLFPVCLALSRHAPREKVFWLDSHLGGSSADTCHCNGSTARSRDLQRVIAFRRLTSPCDHESLLFCFSRALFDTQL